MVSRITACRVLAGMVVLDGDQPDAARPAALDLDRAGDRHLAPTAAPAAAGERIVVGAAGNRPLVDLDQAGERLAAGRDHGAAQLGAQQPGGLVGAEAELLLQLQRRDAVGMGRHQVGRPEPQVSGSFEPCSTVPAVTEVWRWQAAHSKVQALVASAHPLTPPQAGQTKPSGQRAAVSQAAQAAGSGKRRWNSSSERGKLATTASGVVVCSLLFCHAQRLVGHHRIRGTGPSGISL